MLFKVCSTCCDLDSPGSKIYRNILSKYTIERGDGLFIDTDIIFDLQLLLHAAEEFYNSDAAPDYMWTPPYKLIIDFENKEITIYDSFREC